MQIILLVERLNHSDGPKKIQMAYGTMHFGKQQTRMTNDLTRQLRKQYPELFMANEPSEEDSLFQSAATLTTVPM